jgi:hypothetical protein
VAPFYYDWPIELGLLNSSNTLVSAWKTDWKLSRIVPNETPTRWSFQADLTTLAPGRYFLVLRVVNPLPSGLPLRFANQSQDQHLPGWLTLGEWNQP